MKKLTLDQRSDKIESVIRSCKNFEQLKSCVIWIGNVYLPDDDWTFYRNTLYDRAEEMIEYLKKGDN